MASLALPDWAGRIARVRAELEVRDLGALVVSDRHNILYLTGFAGSAGLLLVTRDELRLILDGRYELVARQALDAGRLAAVTIGGVAARYDLTLAQTVNWMAPRRIGFEAGNVTVATLRAWQKGAPQPEWVPTDQLVERLRQVKDAYEVGVLRRGGGLISEVAGQLAQLVRPGLSERAVAERIDRAIRDVGFSAPAFETIVASGPNSAHPHAHPGDRVLAGGDLVVLDFGGVLDGYCLDLTRMAAVGTVAPEARALFDGVLAAHRMAVEAVRPGLDVW